MTGVTPGVTGGNGGTIRATVSAGTSGKLRLQTTVGITASTSYTLTDFDADDPTGLETISFQGTVSDVNAALASLNFRRITDTGTNTLTASVTEGTGLVFGTNYYEVYNSSDVIGGSSSISWDNAFKFAASRKLDSTAVGISCQGYLATITSADEQEFAYERVKTASWIGASDEFSYVNAATGATTYANQTESEGKFYWVTGPERGTQISNNNGSSGRDIVGVYQNWNGEEPNDLTAEHAVQMLSGGKWNDLSFSSIRVAKFIVEYGGVRTTGTHTQTYTDVSFDNAGEVGTVATCTPAIVAGTQTASFSAQSSVPAGAPTGAAATVTAGITSAALTWNAPGSDGGSAIAGYKVEYSANNGATWTTASANTLSAATSFTVTGLALVVPYIFRVFAINAIDTSAASASSVSVTIPGVVPDSPNALKIVHSSQTTATLSWAPGYNGGVAISGYLVEYEKGGSWLAATASGTSAAITGINLDSAWSFRVAAINSIGTGAFSRLVNAPPVPYSGPIVSSLEQQQVVSGSTQDITINGARLAMVTSVTIDGKPCVIATKSDGQLVIRLPAGLTPGLKDLKIVYTGGAIVTHQGALTVIDAPVETEASLSKVNAGSFKGFVAIYALNQEGKRLSGKVGNDWVIVESIPKSVNNLYRHVEFTGVGYEVQVRIFIDRKLEAKMLLLTK